MARTRSPLETAIVAWIALKIMSLLLGYGLVVETLKHPGGARLNPDVGRFLGYASIAVLVWIVVMLLADGRYLIAAGLVGLVVALPLVIESGRAGVATRLPLQGGSARHGAAGAARSDVAPAAALPVATLNGAVRDELESSPRARGPAESRAACGQMTARARAELTRAFARVATSIPGACPPALAAATRRFAFGAPDPGYARVLRAISLSVSADGRRASYVTGNGTRVELMAVRPAHWYIDGFSGGAFAAR
jgi:hypothetical protein